MAAEPPIEDGVRRRDFIHVASGTFLAAGAALAAWPFINQMNPSADVLALATTEVDLTPIAVGQRIKVMWQGKPVFIAHRTAEEIAAAQKSEPDRDPQPDSARVEKGKEQWLVIVGVCTHLGCVPQGTAQGEVRGDYKGWFCPCHGSHYDTSGRIVKGPAPLNLPVPKHSFVSDTRVMIG
jgi:ubiquinol-cytochrome c reductase iron-sulfur subunit